MVQGQGSGNLVHERGLADVGEAGDKKGPGVGVDRRKTRQMLTHLEMVRGEAEGGQGWGGSGGTPNQGYNCEVRPCSALVIWRVRCC